MFIVIPVLLPVIAVVAIMASPFWNITIGTYEQKKLNRKKLLIFAVSSLAATAAISGMLYGFGALSVYDKEVWHFKALKVRYEEKWTTKERHTREVACGRDKDGHTKYRTEVYYTTETHGPYWTTIDENVAQVSTSRNNALPAKTFATASKTFITSTGTQALFNTSTFVFATFTLLPYLPLPYGCPDRI